MAFAQGPLSGADEPPPLGPVYRERVRVALRDAAGAGRLAAQAKQRFFEIVGSQREAVAVALGTWAVEAADPADRSAAALGLGLLARTQDVPPLAAALAGEGVPAVRTAIADALGRCGGPMARRLLMELVVRDPAEEVRTAAVSGLHATGEPSVPWALAVTKRAAATPAGRQAAELLSRMGFTPEEQWELGRDPSEMRGPPPPTAVERWLEAGDPDALRWLVRSVTNPVPALIEGLDHADAAVRRRAARTLWLREHVLAGERAARRDSFALDIARTIVALTDTAPATRTSARARLVWAARTDLGATAQAWRVWWTAAQPQWRAPAESPPGGTGREDPGEGR